MADFLESIAEYSIDKYYENIWNRIVSSEKFFMFGASAGFYTAIKWFKKKDSNFDLNKICGIFDNDPYKIGEKIMGIPVYSPKSLNDAQSEIGYKDELIVITSGSAHQIIPQLIEYGVDKKNMFVFTISYGDSFIEFPKYFLSHMDDFNYVYGLLSDEKSRDVFLNLINFRLTADFGYLKNIYDDYNNQYFDADLVNFYPNDIYVDCGAYVGDTVKSYCQHNGGVYGEVISIEADPSTFERLSQNTESYRNVICINKGVWNRPGKIKFKCTNSSGANCISDEGNVVIDTDSIDSILRDKRINHLKMDIEGSEVPALIGAYETITKCKPTLAICVYHNIEDYVRIPLLIKSFCPDYKIYFRHYQMMSAQESVCYAVYDPKS